jgi:DNA polymerase-4
MRQIVHLDADAFFASVEQAADPRLRGRPVAVGAEKRGIIASASYEARRMGVDTPMPTWKARRLCPGLVLLPGDFEKYERFSRFMFSYAYDFTPEVEVCSIDEGWFDLSGARKPPVEIADRIRDAIRQSLKLSVSQGIGTNKLVSQVASKLRKPAAFLAVPPGAEALFLQPLPNRWLPGVGPKLSARLDAAGLVQVGQVAATPVNALALMAGATAARLRELACGVDPRPVVPRAPDAQSYSRQETFPEDTTDEAFLEAALHRMADRLMARARADAKSVRTLAVTVRGNDMLDDRRSESLPEPTDLETDLYPRLRPLLRAAWRRRVSVRMLGLKLSNVYGAFPLDRLPLDDDARRRGNLRRLAGAMDRLREEFGERAVFRPHSAR